jgi:hypothetical protein
MVKKKEDDYLTRQQTSDYDDAGAERKENRLKGREGPGMRYKPPDRAVMPCEEVYVQNLMGCSMKGPSLIADHLREKAR